MTTNIKREAATATKSGKLSDVVEPCTVGPIVVVIDPGHGDIFNTWLDPGVVYPNPFPEDESGFKESNLALGVSKALKIELLKDSTLVKSAHLTREGDLDDKKRVRFKWRIAVAREKEARIFISIHLNSPAATGGHMIMYRPTFAPGPSRRLAEKVSDAYKIVPPLDENIVAEKLGVLALGGTKVKAAILIETGYITTEHDRTTIHTKPAEVAKEIASGVHAYIKENLEALCKDEEPTPPIPKARPKNK